MKAIVKISVLVLTVMFMASSAMALPFSSTGVVNYNYNNSWNETTLTGVAEVSLFIDTPGINVIAATLEFESDIFNLDEIDADDFSVVNPSGWTTPDVNDVINEVGVDNAKISISIAGQPATTENDPIIIQFAYTLLGAEMYNNVSGDGWAWNEGQAWGITYLLAGPSVSIYEPTISGGSTAPVPEPATMLLLGTGLAGVAAVRRRKIKKA